MGAPTDSNGNGDSESDTDNDFDEYEEWPWLEQLDSVAKIANDKIGSCHAKMIRRDKIRGTFWREMEDACRETGSFAVDLFDRYGRLRKDLQEHPIRKGTGVWGPGLDQDDLLLFSELAVKSAWRRQ